jgi:uncharacterized protein (TIGR00369 family)
VIDQPVRERLVRWDDPAAFIASSRGLTGLEALRSVLGSDGPKPPIGSLMNFWLVEVNEGHAVFEGEPGEYHYNPIGTVHGGFALALMDSALGCSVHSALPADVGYTTTDVQVRFIRGMTAATGRVRCEGRTLHVGRTTGIAEARLTDSRGKLLATGTTACAIFR